MKCALCGHTFDENIAVPVCGRCPLAQTCALIRCPHCGYEAPVEPAWLIKLRQLFKRKTPDRKVGASTENSILKMSVMKPNEGGEVAYLQTRDKDTLQKLMAMGLLPGTAILILQRYPTVVFQVGKTQFAVDKALATHVYVRRW